MGENEDACSNTCTSKISNHLNCNNESFDGNITKTLYYGVHIPSDIQVQEGDAVINIFLNKADALKFVKKYKKARFKAFDECCDAEAFAENGSECPNIIEVPKSNDSVNIGEKHSPFRGPTPQNLVKLRKGIETGDLDFVEKTIWDNPRYLIGAGDTPSILQEGSRYNALHVGAKAKNADMYDREPEERAKILLDLYLNTPDKGLNEAPLHFAVKFGAAKCVDLFVSYPQCDRDLRNKHGKSAKEIICDRYDGPDAKQVQDEIATLLEDNYYVPVLRSEDNCAPPIIGTPFSPTSPPNLNNDPLSPRMEIHAYAGPMNREGADQFRKLMKTPPRNLHTPLRASIAITSLKLKDPEKGLERLGNNLARKMDVPWKEYWQFLDSFVDLASEDGLQQFERYLSEKVAAKYVSNSPSPPAVIPPTRFIGVSKLTRFGDHTSSADNLTSRRKVDSSPLTELCIAMQACKLDDTSLYSCTQELDVPNVCVGMLSDGVQVNNREITRADDQEALSSTPNPTLCIEKGLQVFAKRISNDIMHLIDSNSETCMLIETQIKQLQLLMASYRCDSRFEFVNFSVAHNRLASMIKAHLAKYLVDTGLTEAITRISAWLDFSGTHDAGFSTDDEGAYSGNSVLHSKSQHTRCLLQSLHDILKSQDMFEDAISEAQCVNLWTRMKPCRCTWELKIKQNGSRRHQKSKYSAFTMRDFPRKLSFEENNPDAFVSFENGDASSSEEAENDADVFYTPPGTPSLLEEMEDEDIDANDVFYETQLPDNEIFIEGDMPTKVDYAAFNALEYAECDINSNDFPNIYRWHHAVGLFNEKERVCWGSPSRVNNNLKSPPLTSTPVLNRTVRANAAAKDQSISPSFAPAQTWLRVTGANSPRASLKMRRMNASFNF